MTVILDCRQLLRHEARKHADLIHAAIPYARLVAWVSPGTLTLGWLEAGFVGCVTDAGALEKMAGTEEVTL